MILAGLIGLTLLGPTRALAGVGDGGGNSLKGQMIEDYLVVDPDQELPGFKEAIDGLVSRIDEAIPDFAKAIRIAVKEQNWYLIPQKIKRLPESVTGLHFETDQCAYQSGNEIFIDEDCFQEFPSIASKQTLYKHEALMATLGVPAEKIRLILGFMKKNPNFTGDDLRSKLNQIDSKTPYYRAETRAQQIAKKSLREDALARLQAVCSSNLSSFDKKVALLEADTVNTKIWKESLKNVDGGTWPYDSYIGYGPYSFFRHNPDSYLPPEEKDPEAFCEKLFPNIEANNSGINTVIRGLASINNMSNSTEAKISNRHTKIVEISLSQGSDEKSSIIAQVGSLAAIAR
ncbi:MAG: hypothetical protein A2Z97_01300 [Bdellovibrionales bacterium GWB1_52_6]|nr:MAG: hypothetical protein A2Z97_01300 [Bdellovibrionales bacterium GWB1_52_6]HCM41198.1 hypothetical protein [Bdellovibrionales bacterium]